MSLKNKDFITIDDFSNQEIEAVFSLADEMSESLYSQSKLCQGKIMASLFFEPSTRTRLSFEAAMYRLGGQVITAMDVHATSLAKGESIADMARVIGSYADIIVLRHPWEGAAKVAADYAGIPVINAGDGGHEHPTQTLCDLYTIKKERKTIEGLKIALCGDLKYGRTIHSLTYALARMGATIIFCPGPGLQMPEHAIKKLTTEYGGELRKIAADEVPSLVSAVGGEGNSKNADLDAIYITPSYPHQPALLAGVDMRVDLKSGVDALYVTRLQKERQQEDTTNKNAYPVIDKAMLKGKEFKRTLVMHPLPRVDELAYEVDADPRSMYFKQAARGVPVRMALIALLLGAKTVDVPSIDVFPARRLKHPIYRHELGVKCRNKQCVSQKESKYILPEFEIINCDPLTLRCMYCEHESHPPYIASAKWHQGTLDKKLYHSAESFLIDKIRLENLIIFDSRNEAESAGFKPSHYSAPHDEDIQGGGER